MANDTNFINVYENCATDSNDNSVNCLFSIFHYVIDNKMSFTQFCLITICFIYIIISFFTYPIPQQTIPPITNNVTPDPHIPHETPQDNNIHSETQTLHSLTRNNTNNIVSNSKLCKGEIHILMSDSINSVLICLNQDKNVEKLLAVHNNSYLFSIFDAEGIAFLNNHCNGLRVGPVVCVYKNIYINYDEDGQLTSTIRIHESGEHIDFTQMMYFIVKLLDNNTV